ncbi:molybdopterin oxidoreductase family protein [Chitinilyticum litopenaei]|uniref:molybdopterin oxidoreductase family protein n=1 Tax=Chitinilyticum litopenaei TaxID=1121276 RepID=UPI0005BE1C28|nr:molybdopterin-dependent oxidoreductase [Chitinilyticum litopenaei]
MNLVNYKPCVCNLCGTGCGQFLKTDGHKVYGVSPLIAHPVSKGKLCIRGWHSNELLSTNERITTPLIRENGELREASYDEAIALVAARMQAFDGAAGEIGVLASARSSNEDSFTLARLTRDVFKTTLRGIGAEAGHRKSMAALEQAFGYPGAHGSLTAIDHADYILVVGTDITRQNPVIGGNIHAAQRRGARVVTLSSSRTQIAKLSTKHFQEKPGTLGLLVNALGKALMAIRTVNHDRRANIDQLPGYADYAAALRSISSVALERASGIRYEEIEEEAHHLEQARSIVILFSSGISGLDRPTIDAITNLALLSDRMDHPHSAVIPVAGISNLQGSFDMGMSGELGNSVFKALATPDSRIRALFVIDHDDGIIRDKERIAALDFVVYACAYKSAFMELADVVFPLPAYNETDGTYTASDKRVQITHKNVDSRHHVLPGWSLFERIANASGQHWGYHNAAQVFKDIAAHTRGYGDLSHELLSKGFGQHWNPQGFAGCGRRKFNAINIEYWESPTTPEFPFALMIGKAQHYWHQNNLMRKTIVPRREYDQTLWLYPHGYIEISPDDAVRLKVRDKWLVNVRSSIGTHMKIAVKISPDVQDGTAYIPYFIKNMISDFLLPYENAYAAGEESVIPIQIQE